MAENIRMKCCFCWLSSFIAGYDMIPMKSCWQLEGQYSIGWKEHVWHIFSILYERRPFPITHIKLQIPFLTLYLWQQTDQWHSALASCWYQKMQLQYHRTFSFISEKQNKNQNLEAHSSTSYLQKEVRLQCDEFRRQSVMVEHIWKNISKTYFYLASLENTYPFYDNYHARVQLPSASTLRSCYMRHCTSKTWVQILHITTPN